MSRDIKIVSWNCNGGFRNKFSFILKENADIYVIQECENPFRNEYKEIFDSICIDYHLSLNYKWCGLNQNKGVAIFVKNDIELIENGWKVYCLHNFIPLTVKLKNVEGSFDLVGVWTRFQGIEEYFIFQDINKEKYSNKTILIGDFNSNQQWDKKHFMRSHTSCVEFLKSKNLVSGYHLKYNEEYGKESCPTFYMYKKIERPYHIDYCFINKEYVKSFEILCKEEWLMKSDHFPIIVEVHKSIFN